MDYFPEKSDTCGREICREAKAIHSEADRSDLEASGSRRAARGAAVEVWRFSVMTVQHTVSKVTLEVPG